MSKKLINIVPIVERWFRKGDRMFSPIFGDVRFKCVDDEDKVIVTHTGGVAEFDKCGRFYGGIGDCLLFPHEHMRSWLTFRSDKVMAKAKPGDVLALFDGDKRTAFCILKKFEGRDQVVAYAGGTYKSMRAVAGGDITYITREYDLATEEEKKYLFRTLDKKGLVWDSKDRVLRKRPWRFPDDAIDSEVYVRMANSDYPFDCIFMYKVTCGDHYLIAHATLVNERLSIGEQTIDYCCGDDVRKATDDEREGFFDKFDGSGFFFDERSKTIQREPYKATTVTDLAEEFGAAYSDYETKEAVKRGFIAGANHVLSELSEVIVGKWGNDRLTLRELKRRMKAFRTGVDCED